MWMNRKYNFKHTQEIALSCWSSWLGLSGGCSASLVQALRHADVHLRPPLAELRLDKKNT